MKVLHVISSIAFARGGPSLAVIEMAKALNQSGIEAEIATTNDNGLDVLDVPLGQRIQYKTIPVWFFPRFASNVRVVREFSYSSELTAWLWQNIRNYDLIHVHGIFSYPSTIAMTIARHHQIPYIVRPFGQLCNWSLQQSAHRKQVYLKLLERDNLNHCQFLHFTSEKEQQEAAELHLVAPSFILPHGLSIPPTIPDARRRLRQHLNLPDDEPIVLFLSRLHPKKGLDYLIPALAKLADRRFTFILAGAGSSDYEADLKSLLVANNIQNRTVSTGLVTGQLKNLLLQGSDLFALTSYSENFGISVLEALAAGLPALVTPGVALADLVKQQQLGYVPELNVSDIASSIRQALDYPNAAKAMSDRACQFISENYTWESVITKMRSIYERQLTKSAIQSSLRQRVGRQDISIAADAEDALIND